MAQAYIQSVSKPSTGVSPMTSLAFGSSTTTGNLIVVTVSDNGGVTNGITSVTDSKGNTYTKIPNESDGSSTLSMWYAKNITGGASHTVTIAWNTSLVSQASFIAQEFSGSDTTSPLDRYTSAHSTSTTPSSGATPTTTTDAQLVVAGVAYFSTNTTTTLGSGYSNLASTGITNANVSMESKVISSAAAQTGTFTLAASKSWAAGVATFKATGGTATLEQEGFQFYDDDAGESSATALASQDTGITRARNTNTRLRFVINATNDPSAKQFQVEAQLTGDTTYTKIPTS